MSIVPRLPGFLVAFAAALVIPFSALAQGTVQTAKPFGGCDSTMGPFCNMSAANSKYLCQVSDGSLLVFSKGGQLIQNKTFTSFLGSQASVIYLNPIIEYDQVSQRWLIDGGVNPGIFAVSYSDDPTGPWNCYSFAFPGADDGGRCGYNASAYFFYMTGSTNGLVVINKASVLANTGTCTWSYVANPPGNNTQGMTQMEDDTTVGNPDDPYWVYGNGNIYKMTNYLSGTATVVTYPVTGGTMAGSKYCMIRNGNMMGVDDFIPNHGLIHWSLVNLATATVMQSGDMPIPEGLQYAAHIYSSISPNGDVGISFWASTVDFSQPYYNVSLGPPVNYFPTAPQMKLFVTGRAASDPAGTMRPCVEVTHGALIPNRPGDYASVTDDPADGTFWACNDAGDANTFSANVNFTVSGTLAAVLPPVMGLGALSIDGTNVNLQWNPVPGAASYQLMRTADQITYTVVATLSGTQTSYTDQPGSPVTAYYYDVLAINGPTTSAAPQPVLALLAPAAPKYDSLAAPSGLTPVLSSTGSGVQLSWSDVTGEKGFGIERAGNGSTWTRIGTTATGVRTYTDASPAGSNLYYYRVEALDSAGGQSVPSTVATITNRPSPPSNVTIHGTWPNQVEVRWLGASSANFNVPSATGFTIYRSTDGVNFSPVGTSPANFDCYVDSGLSAGVQYWYQVVTNGAVGDSLPSSTVITTPVIWTPVNLALTQGTDQVSLQWLPEPGAVSYQVQRSTDGINFSTIATPASPTFTDTTGTANQIYYYEVAAVGAGSGNVSAPSMIYAGIVPPPPSPWQSLDIGLTLNQGCAGYNSGTSVFTIAGIGSDIWGTSDQFHYVYQPFSGNGVIMGRVVSQANTNGWAKAGVMIRNSTAPKDQFVHMLLSESNGVDFQYRTTLGGSAADSGANTSPRAPYYVKLVCSGGTYTGYYSSNGTTWTQSGSVAMAMGQSPLIGLAVCSHNTSAIDPAVMDHVSMFMVPNYSMLVDAGASASLNVLSGITLPSGGSGSVTAVTQGTQGTVVNNAGTVTYTANATGAGQDSFICTVGDGLGDSVVTTVTVQIGDAWENAAGGSWAGAVNWQTDTDPSGIGDTADFSTLSLSANATVTLDGAQTAGMLVFGSQTPYNWTLNAGTGGSLLLDAAGTSIPTIEVNNQTTTINAVISGTQGLVKSGAGALILTAANTYSGATYVNAGTLTVNAKGTVDTGYVIAQNATLYYGYNTLTGGYGPSVTINGSGIGSAAGLYLKGGDTVNITDSLVIQTAPTTVQSYSSGTATIKGWDVNTGAFLDCAATASGSVIALTVNLNTGQYGFNLQVDAGANNTTGDLTINGFITGSGANTGGAFNSPIASGLNKDGKGSLKLTGASTYSSATYIQNGGIILSAGNNRLPAGTTVVLGGNAGNSGILVLGDASGAVTQTIAGLQTNTGINDAVVGGASAVSTLTLNVPSGGSVAYSGMLGGAGTNYNNLAITKSGAGTLTLGGSGTYTGATTVSAGTLTVLGSIGASAVSVQSGATLSGTGATGAVTVASGGTLAPGISGAGSLSLGGKAVSLAGTATLQVNASTGANTGVTGASSVAFGGTLNVTNIAGTLAAGNTFTLFQATSYTGSFSTTTLPALGAGLYWDTSKLAVNGSITVVGQTLTTIKMSPTSASLGSLGTKQFQATAYDQFNNAMVTPPVYAWTVSGVGSVSSTGLYTASYGSGSATVQAASGTVTGSAAISVTAPPFNNWQAQYFGANANNPASSGPTANPSGDGIENLLKYAFNLNPTVCATTGLPVVSMSGGNLILIYRKNDAATDLTYTVQQSTNLSRWITASPTLTILSDTGGTSLIQASVPFSNGTKLMMLQLNVTQP